MPVKYRIDKPARIVNAEGYGEVTDEEMLSYQRLLRADPDFDPSYREVFDFTAVEPFLVTPEGHSVLASSSPWTGGARRAFVAVDDLAYGMLRMFQGLLDLQEREVGVFRTASEAKAWLEENKKRRDASYG